MSAPLKTFIIYARADAPFKAALRRQLIPLEQSDLLEIWDDSFLLPGEDWEKTIKDKLDASELVIMLVSDSSLASDFIQKTELKKTLERKSDGYVEFVPILVRDCLWDVLPHFKNVQMLPLDPHRIPLAVEAWLSQSSAWASSLREVHRLIPDIQQKIAAETQAREAAMAAEKAALEAEEKLKKEQVNAAKAEKLRHRRDEGAWETTQADVVKAETPEEQIEIYQSYLEDHENHRDEAEEAIHTLQGKIDLTRKRVLKREQAERHADLKKEEARNLYLPEMVLIKGGTFQMGDLFDEGEDREKPVHSVTLSDFYLGKYAVTFEEYDRFCAETMREKLDDAGWGRARRPVINVSWKDAQAYCAWLSTKTGSAFRLPTEAEWEYAAREGGKKVRFGNGKEVADPKEINFNASKKYKQAYSTIGEDRQKTVPVGSLSCPNALGLHEMSGNVWEWCQDLYGPYTAVEQNNPTGPVEGMYRVSRGGSWLNDAQICRAAFRYYWRPEYRSGDLGFRLALSLQSVG